MANHKSHWLPVDDPKNTTVLGHLASGAGKGLWQKIDLSNWWADGTERWTYLHVECRKDTEEGREGCVYRVRCRWSVNGKYRGRLVESVGLGLRDGRLHWIVRTKGKEPTDAKAAEA